MKYNSTAIDPNGKIPAINAAGMVFRYHGWNGICLAIWFVFVGWSPQPHFLWAIKAPARAEGMENTNQSRIINSSVVAGIAPEECTNPRKKLRAVIQRNMKPGTKRGVRIILAFQ